MASVFGLAKTQVVQQVEKVAPLPIPEKRAVVVTAPLDDAKFCSDYSAVAKELGYSTPALKCGAFEQFLSERGICVYNQSKVRAYLDEQYGRPKDDGDGDVRGTWGWRPLAAPPPVTSMQQSDGSIVSFGTTWLVGGSSWQWSRNGDLMHGTTAYSKPIPMPVLLTALDIKRQFPGAEFFVSDEVRAEDVIKDPFLLVRYENTDYIVERWDEPRFRP